MRPRLRRTLSRDEILAIASIPNVVGLKQSVAALDADTLAVLRDAPVGFHVFAGDDAYIGPTLLMGAGAISAAAHVCTAEFVAMVSAALAGDAVSARVLAGRLLEIVEAGFAEPSPAVWKAALHRLGEIDTPNLRAPMSCITEATTTRVMDAIARVVRGA